MINNIMMLLFLLALGGGMAQAATGIPPTGSIITLRAVNGQYVSANNDGNILIANQKTAGDDETFGIVDAETGQMKSNGDGASACKDALISITIKPR